MKISTSSVFNPSMSFVFFVGRVTLDMGMQVMRVPWTISRMVRQLEKRAEATGRFGAATENTHSKYRRDRRDRQAARGQEVRAPGLRWPRPRGWRARMSTAEEEVACEPASNGCTSTADNCSGARRRPVASVALNLDLPVVNRDRAQ